MLDQDEFEIPGDDGFGPGTDFVVSIVSILMVMLTLLRTDIPLHIRRGRRRLSLAKQA